MTTITKNTMLAFVDSISHEVKEVIAEGKADIETALAPVGMRAESHYGMEASHVTNTTRKYQCNADLRYAGCVKAIRKEFDLETDGAAIRMIMERGLEAMGFNKTVECVQADRDAASEAE